MAEETKASYTHVIEESCEDIIFLDDSKEDFKKELEEEFKEELKVELKDELKVFKEDLKNELKDHSKVEYYEDELEDHSEVEYYEEDSEDDLEEEKEKIPNKAYSDYNDKEFKELIKNSKSFNDLLKNLGYSQYTHKKYIEKRIIEDKIDISHFNSKSSYLKKEKRYFGFFYS